MDAGGAAACTCDPGFAGWDCGDCAAGFEPDGSGNCILGDQCRDAVCSNHGQCTIDANGELGCDCDPGYGDGDCGPRDLDIEQPEDSIQQGGSIQLVMKNGSAGGKVWSILSGPGFLEINTDGDPPVTTVTYHATFVSNQVEVVAIQAVDPQTGAKDVTTLTILRDGDVPVSGIGRPELAHIDTAMLDYMQGRGIRAASLAVSKDGRFVLRRGYGYLSKGDDSDPWIHGPGESGNTVRPNTPFRIASLTKPLTAFAARRVLSEEGESTNTSAMPYVDTSLGGSPPLDQLPYTLDGQPPFETPDDADYSCSLSLPDQRWDSITVRHLLEHRAGFDRSFGPERWKTFVPNGQSSNEAYGTLSDPLIVG